MTQSIAKKYVLIKFAKRIPMLDALLMSMPTKELSDKVKLASELYTQLVCLLERLRMSMRELLKLFAELLLVNHQILLFVDATEGIKVND